MPSPSYIILFSVTNYVPGGELLQLCQEYGALPEELVRLYIAEIAFALGKIFIIIFFI